VPDVWKDGARNTAQYVLRPKKAFVKLTFLSLQSRRKKIK
jgi:hypothetical protein